MTDPARERQRRSIATWLSAYVAPDQLTELRALNVHGTETWAGWFRGDQLDLMAGAAQQLEGQSTGIYFTPNPLKAAPKGADFGTVLRRSTGETAADTDVRERLWLLIDVDPTRFGEDGEPLKDNKCPSTDAERENAWRVLMGGRTALEAVGFREAVVADSANGWHLCYPIRLPNDDEAAGLVRGFLHELQERFGDRTASFDLKVYNASRIWKVPGSLSRKGVQTPARSYRWARCVVGGEPADRDQFRAHNTTALRHIAGVWAKQRHAHQQHDARPQDGRPGEATAYGRVALDREADELRRTPAGGRNARLNTAAFKMGQLVAADQLGRGDVEAVLTAAALAAGLDERETARTLKSGLEAGLKEPRKIPEPRGGGGGFDPPEPEGTEGASAEGAKAGSAESAAPPPPINVATIDDLIAKGAEIRWLWEGWLQIGVVNVVAAEGGTGKTRFLADLTRRIRHTLPWPDGKPMTVPPESSVLWVVSDNHHDEMVTLSLAFGIKDSVWINADKADPYGGVNLEETADFQALERRIGLVKPVLVIIDTVGNSTDKNLGRQEDAKAYYQPLQMIARKANTTMVCLTHLNAGGKALGRRVMEKVRSALYMDKPDATDDRRRLWVEKSNSKRPDPLGLMMGDAGNEYDNDPPLPPDADDAGRPSKGCEEWLQRQLEAGPRPVAEMITLSGKDGFTKPTLYRAAKKLGVETVEQGTRKFWRL